MGLSALSRRLRFLMGHDAAINIMRRILLDAGAEIIHLGHNHSALDIVRAAVQEDADAIAVSSYQGGHNEFFPYILELLKEAGAEHVQLFGGGGGVIVPREIKELEDQGVAKIYSPEDGRRLGLVGMIEDMIERTKQVRQQLLPDVRYELNKEVSLARCLSVVEAAAENNPEVIQELLKQFDQKEESNTPPIIGVTGTGGAGKSSLVDEILLRFLHDFPEKRVAILSCDPTRKRTGGALLGDRIRINSAAGSQVFLRSMATRTHAGEISGAVAEALSVLRVAGFDLIITETAGAGQSDAAIAPLVDVALYVMTPEYGAATQLEKIGMLDYADLICINKFDRAGAGDALHDVRKQYQRNQHCFEASPEDMPVYGAIASRFNDAGVTALYHGLLETINEKCNTSLQSTLPKPENKYSTDTTVVVPHDHINYLSEIAHTVREYRKFADKQGHTASNIWRLKGAAALISDASVQKTLIEEIKSQEQHLDTRCKDLLAVFPALKKAYAQKEFRYTVRDREICAPLCRESLAGSQIPRVVLPNVENEGDLLRWLLLENLPGYFPYTAGCFPLKRTDEAATRMFAGEGDPKRTNTRFKYLSKDAPAKRLSTAFDSITLYGQDPDERPDIYGKIGSAGVSICTLDDMQQLFDGFDLCAPNTSVSMTINGPAPIILAMFFNTAIEQQCSCFENEQGHKPSVKERDAIKDTVLKQVRGTVQADILKEDQGQNTCLFAIDFGLKMMGDIQEYFLQQGIRNFYSVSVSGYHIAEAGATPITQLAFTLANGFTYVEYYLSRGMDINDFAPNLSFFFSCGMDPEYAVLNRVARRIWAVALRNRYGADERAQKLKAHIQTSGRSLHAQEIHFNDIRTTLQALTAFYDQCNSLHTNAYDEAVTTPTEESVRRALAIQQIISKEHGLAFNENPLQGSFIIEELTTLVEEAVLAEFERLCSRGGVLGAMERGYQRSEIQEESLKYEHLKSSGDYPIVGVNTFINPDIDHEEAINSLELRRGTEEEKRGQVDKLRAFHELHADKMPEALKSLQDVCLAGDNIFAELMETVRTCSLGQITHALFEVAVNIAAMHKRASTSSE